MPTLETDVIREFAQAVPFAGDGPLKMLYDNRMHPQALEVDSTRHP